MADFDEDEEDEQQQQTTIATAKAAAPVPAAVKREPSSSGGESKEGGAMDDDDEDGEGADEDGEDDEDAQVAELDFDADGAAADESATATAAASDPLAPVFSNDTPIAAISSLLHSEKLQMHLAIISHFQFGTPLPASGAAAVAAAQAAAASPAAAAAAPSAPPPPVNTEREYPYIVASNELSFEIDNHISALHKYARDLYAPRYGELEQLLSNPVEYARVAQLIGNETDMARITKLVQGVPSVPNNVLLTISVTATTTRGRPLPPAELAKLHAVCDTILQLDHAKTRMHAYISSRMSALAPNVSAMLGTDVAAKLVALAGGIKKLSEMPACNVQNLGKRGKNSSGLSRIAQGIHDGLIVTCKVIEDTPAALRQRAMRLLAGKLTLAARLDAFGAEEGGSADGGGSSAAQDGARGQEFLADITAKIEKWQEPTATKTHKALPVPLQRSKAKRGGKRYRKEKERMAVTEIAKQKNRMFFGKEEIVDEYTGEGMGMLGQQGTGVLRVAQKDAKLAKRLSQKTQARLKRATNQPGGAKAALAGLGTVTSLAAISGTASSIAFTPMQGMQLVPTDSAAVRAMHKQPDTYFSNSGSFSRVKKEAGGEAKRALPPVPSFSQAAASAAAVGSAAPPDAKRQKIG